MATELREFLAGLATDPNSLAGFMADADAAMEKAELAENDRQLLKGGNLAAIHARLAGEQGGGATPQIVVVVGLENLQRMYTDAMRAVMPPGAVPAQAAPWQPALMGAVAAQAAPWQP